MRRLNERNEDYHESLNKLKTKCIKSNLNRKLTENQFLEFKNYKETQLVNTSSKIAKQKQISSKKCNKCSLCANHGHHTNMVLD